MQESRIRGRLAAVLVLCLGCCNQEPHAQYKMPFDIVRSEGDGIIRFARAFQDYSAGCQALRKRPKVTRADIADVERKANAVRLVLSEYRRHMAGFISKLKAANMWTSEFDSHFVEMAAKSGYTPAMIADIKGTGGARSTLEMELDQIRILSAGVELTLKELIAIGSGSTANLQQDADAAVGTKTCGVYLAAMIACTCICSRPPCPCAWLQVTTPCPQSCR